MYKQCCSIRPLVVENCCFYFYIISTYGMNHTLPSAHSGSEPIRSIFSSFALKQSTASQPLVLNFDTTSPAFDVDTFIVSTAGESGALEDEDSAFILFTKAAKLQSYAFSKKIKYKMNECVSVLRCLLWPRLEINR